MEVVYSLKNRKAQTCEIYVEKTIKNCLQVEGEKRFKTEKGITLIGPSCHHIR